MTYGRGRCILRLPTLRIMVIIRANYLLSLEHVRKHHEHTYSIIEHVYFEDFYTLLYSTFFNGFPFTSSSTPTAKCFRSFYDWFSNVIEIVPLALLTSGILSAYQVDEKIRMLLLFFGIVPVFFPLSMKQKEGQIRKLRFLTNITVVLQILAITILGLKNGNYNVISLVASYTFERFFVEEFCYRYNIPYTDLMQYCICFVEVFTVSTLKEL